VLVLCDGVDDSHAGGVDDAEHGVPETPLVVRSSGDEEIRALADEARVGAFGARHDFFFVGIA